MRPRSLGSVTAASIVLVGTVFFGSVSGASLLSQHKTRAAVWRQATPVPGLAALDKRSPSGVVAMSCPSPGNCAAVGTYGRAGHQVPFVTDETHGRWQRALALPGIVSLENPNVPAAVASTVSCGSAGNCSAGGDVGPSGGFISNEVNGVWENAIAVPGLASLAKGGGSDVVTVSCASAGNCSAGGGYYVGTNPNVIDEQAFVVNETKGTWGDAIEVPGTAALNTSDEAQVEAMSCPSADNCTAGGSYAARAEEAFVVVERSGSWGVALELPGIAKLSSGGNTTVLSSLSCAAVGYCAGVGSYSAERLGPSFERAFVVNEVNGKWHAALEVPGLTRLVKDFPEAFLSQVSCGSRRSCAAVGGYNVDLDGNSYNAFVVTEVKGIWRAAIRVPGLTPLDKGHFAELSSVSCASAGNCSAGGFYAMESNVSRALLVDEASGRWQHAIAVRPGIAKGKAVNSVSCASANSCAAGGGGSAIIGGNFRAFLVERSAT